MCSPPHRASSDLGKGKNAFLPITVVASTGARSSASQCCRSYGQGPAWSHLGGTGWMGFFQGALRAGEGEEIFTAHFCCGVSGPQLANGLKTPSVALKDHSCYI